MIKMLTATRYDTTVPDGAKCQEASTLSRLTYVPCLAPAVAIINNGDVNPYFMCGPCASHNVKNRRAKVIFIKPGEERWVA